ncbi:hypothetical protein L0156_27010 [bacterium]|nr:hypothetical protein [bacterium]
MANRKDTSENTPSRDEYQLRFVGLKAGDEPPHVVVQAIDKNNKILHSADVGAEGKFTLPADVLKRSQTVIIGPPPDEKGALVHGGIRYRSEEFNASIIDGRLGLAEAVWGKFFCF